MKITSKVFPKEIRKIDDKAFLALIETADALHSDVVQSQTMPMDTGALQNRGGGTNAKGENVNGTNLDIQQNIIFKKYKVVKVVSEAPYARRLYFHPEYNFSKDRNANAGGLWFDPYVSGNKKDFVPNTFARLMRSKMR